MKTKYLLKDEISKFHLFKDRIVIGSVVSADVRLVDDGVAPIHAVIELGGDKPLIYDMASDQGLIVNGNRVYSHTLQPGDELLIGRRRLKFGLDTESDRPPVDSGDVALLELDEKIEPIFDWSQTQRPSLEVVVSWAGSILDVVHLSNYREKVTVGQKSSDLVGVHEFLGVPEYRLVERRGEDLYLRVSEGMRGVVNRTGKMQRIDQLKREPALLRPGDFAKVQVGELDFYMTFTQSPPRLKRKAPIAVDPFLRKSLLTSLATTAFLLGSLFFVKVPETIEADVVPPPLVSILYQPDQYKQPTAPVDPALSYIPPEVSAPKKNAPSVVDLSKTNPGSKSVSAGSQTSKASKGEQRAQSKKVLGQNQAKEGKGARAKGPEGTRGQKNAPANSEKQELAKRPSPQSGTGLGGGSTALKKKRAQDQGNLDALAAATGQIENLLASTAEKLGKSGKKVQGFGGFTTQGTAGKALSGSGVGGGGNADNLGGLADTGRGGGKVGTGLGAAGTGSGIIGGKTRIEPRAGGNSESVVLGQMDGSLFDAVLRAHRQEFQLCYEREANTYQPNLRVQFVTKIAIAPSGRVYDVGIPSAVRRNDRVQGCVQDVIRRLVFPMPEGAGMVSVEKTFKFEPSRPAGV